jgi:regulator of replication initiation timing
MEHDEPIISESPMVDYSSTVDTSRPFTSVKEAVAILGERLLVGEIYSPSPKPFSFSETTTSSSTNTATTAPYYSPSVTIKREPSWRSMPSSPSPFSPIKSSSSSFKEEENNNTNSLFDTVKKLEAELEKTKTELKKLKERGSETEVALATLNAELHKNMSKLAQAEAAAAGKAAAKTVRFENIVERENIHNNNNSNINIKGGDKKMMNSQTLSEMINLGENDHLFGGGKKRHNKSTKQKPIIPLLGDLFFKRRNSSSTNHHNNPLYASPF